MSASQPAIDIGLFYGPNLIAILLTTALWSVACVQTVVYFLSYKKEKRALIRLTVIILFFLLCVNALLYIIPAYRNLITNFDHPEQALVTIIEYVFNLIIAAIITVIVQAFFVFRIYIFLKRRIVVWILFAPIGLFEILGPLVFVSTVLKMRVDAGHDLPLFVTFTIKQEKLMLAFYGISPAVDLVIAATMWYYLSKRQEETHFAKTASLLHRLTILSINSGLWTALFACATLILVLATPVTNLYSIFAFPIGALYVNSLLLNLITRRYLTNSSSQASSSGGNVLQLTPMNRSEIVNVSITREEHKHSDAFATELGQLGQPHIGGEALSASDWK